MNLKSLNETELDHRIKSLAAQERKLLHEALLTIKEIDRRRTYLDLGFGNLFSYLTEGVGYSAGSAQRRIGAARLLNEVPALGEKIQSGELKLNQISLVQKVAREVQKTTSQKISSSQKLEILESLSHKNHEDSEKTVAAFFDLPVLQATKKQFQADESLRIELTLSKELYTKIQEAQGLLSHVVPTSDLVKYLEYVTLKVIESKKRKNPKNLTSQKNTSPGRAPAATVAVKPFSQKTKNQVLSEKQCCQYIDPLSHRQCKNRWFLQVDHKHSLWANGPSTPENAQVLCVRHNRHKYMKEAGIRYQ